LGYGADSRTHILGDKRSHIFTRHPLRLHQYQSPGLEDLGKNYGHRQADRHAQTERNNDEKAVPYKKIQKMLSGEIFSLIRHTIHSSAEKSQVAVFLKNLR
jgi:hypothetical protein